MRRHIFFLLIGANALMMTLSACGGGGAGVAKVPPPPPTPTPTPTPTPSPAPATTSLNIIDGAPTGLLAVAGASSTSAYSGSRPLENLTIDSRDQPSFRYDATTDVYEAKLPGGTWETLSTTDGTLPDWARVVTSTDGPRISLGYDRKLDAPDPYPYSTLVHYSAPGDVFGWLAIGIPTAQAALPAAGSATFNGIVRGSSDYLVDDGWGGRVPGDVTGTVTLSFDFAKGSLSGSIAPSLWEGTALGTFKFQDTVYSAGQYSGSFATSEPGLNGFYGQLTGPHGEELIGAWALPFVYDGEHHEAMGAWLAKQAP